MKLAIIIPTVNQVGVLKKALISLLAQSLIEIETIIVLDGTNQSNQQIIKKFCCQHQLKARFLINRQSHGFARAVNQGIKSVQSELIVLMNDDVVLQRNCLKALLDFYRKHQNQQLYGQALVLNKQGEIDTAGGELLSQGRVKMLKCSKKIQLVSATLAFYPRRLFDQVGFFDERFGSYLEDVDLSLRANKKGWQGYLVPQARAIHLGQATSQTRRAYKQWHDFKNWLIIAVKHREVFDWKNNWRLILVERLRNLSGLFKAILKP
ncbi:glycosyltransferase [Patescibacteria group bacterium]|nr:glycosyltransferase [Patescibacteria group bacterium]MBU1931633.1 glycosyltransferase [Patescibacteria group bacterium]